MLRPRPRALSAVAQIAKGRAKRVQLSSEKRKGQRPLQRDLQSQLGESSVASSIKGFPIPF